MGAFSLVITNNKGPININFTNAFVNMRNRGPDDTSYAIEQTTAITRYNEDQVKLRLSKKEIAEYKQFTFITGFHRLSINDTSLDATQPFEDPIIHKVLQYPHIRSRPKRKLLCTGEIYNYGELMNQEGFTDSDLQSNSDVEIILPLYIKYGLEETLKKINGDYSFIITENLETYDLKTVNVYVVRDILGIKPIYMVKSTHPSMTFFMFASELKGIPKHILEDKSYTVCEVPPGCYWSFQNSVVQRGTEDFIRYCDWSYYKDITNCTITSALPDVVADIYTTVEKKLRKSVEDRYVLSNVPVGVLLSGGFDSSIALSLLVDILVKRGHNFIETPVYAFTIGDIENEDVQCANAVVDHLEKKYNIDIHHHIVCMNDNKKLTSAISDVVYTLETYDATTVRGALPYSLLFEYIKSSTNVKVLLTGEGLDELCGYEQFFQMNDEMFQTKSVKLLTNMHRFDLLRADKMAGMYGLELRHPFLDRDVVEYILTIHPRLKRPQTYKHDEAPIEKYLIRKSFDAVDDNELLPFNILWRRRQDAAVCFACLQEDIDELCDKLYTNNDVYLFANSLKGRADTNTKPATKEQLHYRKLFERHFGTKILIDSFWEHLWE